MNDSLWGPMIAVAIGGVFVKVLRDSVLAPLPVTPAKVEEMLASLHGQALLRGVRGTPPAAVDTLAAVIAPRRPCRRARRRARIAGS